MHACRYALGRRLSILTRTVTSRKPLLLLALLVTLATLAISSTAAAEMMDEGGGFDAAPPQMAAPSEGVDAPSVVSELTDKRSAYSRTYQLSDGTRRVDVSLLPINYKDADGLWQLCDTTISPSNKSGYSHENDKNAFESLFVTEGIGRGTVAVNDGAFGIEISPLKDAKAADPRTDGRAGLQRPGGVRQPVSEHERPLHASCPDY